MTSQTRATLKGYFNTNDQPTEAQFVDLIDSAVNVSEEAALFPLLAGRAGGQTLYGGTGANDDITIHGTSDATRTTSYVLLQPTAGNVGIGAVSGGSLRSKFTIHNESAATNQYFLDLIAADTLFGEIVWDPNPLGVRGFGLFNGTYFSLENTDINGNPQMKLSLQGASYGEVRAFDSSNALTKVDLKLLAHGNIYLQTINSDDVYVSGGRVGIHATTAPCGWLDVRENTDLVNNLYAAINASHYGTPAKRLCMGYTFENGVVDAGILQSMQAGVGFKILALNPMGGNVGIGDFAPAEKLDVTGNANVTGVYKVDDVQVLSNRVIDARAADVANSGDATTDGLIDALRDAMIAHGLIAAA